MSYQTFQNQVSSEKITLSVLHASKRLMAWTLHSGSIYKLENFDVQVIVSIEDSGNTYTEVQSIAEVTASKFYNDRDNKVLYLRTTGSDNPNGRFLALTFKLFFASSPVTLPHDLASGSEVYWEGSIKSTSAFGVEIDTINQTSEAIEGSGSLTLFNDQSFWPSNFDKLTFENKPCSIYSYSRGLEPSEAKMIFKGTVDKKTYSNQQIQFSFKDLLSQLQDPILLNNIEDLALRNSSDLDKAKQRMIFGRVHGHRPLNVDEVLDGYPLTGTVSITKGLVAVAGSGTTFLNDFSPNDKIILDSVEYTVATVVSDTSLTITEAYAGSVNLVASTYTIIPELPKRYINREWIVSGHALRQPSTTVTDGSSITRIFMASTKDIYDGDLIYIGDLGSGELVRVQTVVSPTLLTLAASLAVVPLSGTSVFKPAIQNVRIDDVLLTYERDYSFNATTGLLTLLTTAEKNASPLKRMASNLVFTNTSRVVTGTSLKSLVKPGTVVGAEGQATFFEVLSVDSDTQLTLRVPSTYTHSNFGLYKDKILDPENSVLTCDAMGRTDDDTSDGNLLDSAPKIVRQLLIDMGLASSINEASFTLANDLASQPVGLVIPAQYEDINTPTYREVLNKINPSVFGTLIQDQSFLFSYLVLRPHKSSSALRLQESDVLGTMGISNAGDKIIKTAIVIYKPLEYNYLTKKESVNTSQKTSTRVSYLIKNNRQRTFQSILVDTSDAERHAARWSLILENSTGIIKIKTKLQSVNLEIGSVVDLTHRKLYERSGSTSKRKLGLVESVKKDGMDVEISLVDLSNTFNRIAAINDLTTTWGNTDEEGRIYGGFISDDYGLISNDSDSFGCNLIW